MVDLSQEQRLTLQEAANIFGVSTNTVRAYTKLACKPLETVRLGGRTIRTSLEAVKRFQTQDTSPSAASAHSSFQSDAERKRQYKRDMESLRTNHHIGTESRHGKATKAKNARRA